MVIQLIIEINKKSLFKIYIILFKVKKNCQNFELNRSQRNVFDEGKP